MNRMLVAAAVVASALAAPSVRAQDAARPAAPTFSKDVAPILYKECTSCHRPGEIAPMSLLTYSSARPYARAIATQVSRGTMPPWHADPAHGEFQNERRLSPAEKETILAWVGAGAPEGNPADLPPPPVYPEGWNIGRPDAVFAIGEDYPIPPQGTLDYKHFEVPTNFTEDKWIKAFEVKPGNPAVVHHVIVYARLPRRAAEGDATSEPAAGRGAGNPLAALFRPFSFAPGMNLPPEVRAARSREEGGNDRPRPAAGLGAYVGGFTPGQGVRVFHDGTAMRLPAGSTLIFQMHYTATGQATTDRTKIGFVFVPERPAQEAMTVALLNQNFTLPAGAPNTRVDAQMTFHADATLWSLLPHTHVRGREWLVEATYPDGRREVLLAVPNYDFNWQTDYVLKEPLRLPKGTILRTSAWYDNSPGNRSNPDPGVDVHWGDQTWEEMQFTALTITLGAPRKSPSQE